MCNRALGAIASRSTISSINENSTEANECNRWYDMTRQAVLRKHNWGFARMPVTMTLLGTAPGVDDEPATDLPWSFMPWSYEYAYPQDCLKFRLIIPTIPGVPVVPRPWLTSVPPIRWARSADRDTNNVPIRVILTDQPQAVGVYTFDCTNPDLFDDLYMEALVYTLAANIAMPVTGNPNIGKGMMNQAQDTIMRAMAADGNEGLRTQNTTPDWMAIRGADVADCIDTGMWPTGMWPNWPVG